MPASAPAILWSSKLFTLELLVEEAHPSTWLPQGTGNRVFIFDNGICGGETGRAVFLDPRA
jgi:hypothetical protein